MKKLCVFCGSKSGNQQYLKDAETLGHLLAENKIGLVYGGAKVGLMGALADGVLAKGGDVWGVMPQSLIDLEVAHKDLKMFYTVSNMHERKQKMYDLSDGFLAIPGGMGTLDELFEITTWGQLQYHNKPIWLLNSRGFFDNLLGHLRLASREGFISASHLNLITEVKSLSAWHDDWQKKI